MFERWGEGMGYAHKVSKEKDDSPRGCLPKAIRLTLGGIPRVYATMQPTPEPPCPSASMGVEWMGSDSEALDVTVKRVAKESIVV
jgi:hypothetical protein